VKQIRQNIITLCLILASVFGLPQFASAQTTGATPGVIEQATGKGFVPCGNPGQEPCTVQHVFRGIMAILNFMIAFAAIFAVAMIIWGGFLVTAAGEANTLNKGKNKIKNAIIGFAFVVLSFMVVNTFVSNGSIGLGLKNGSKILTHPLEYINGGTVSNEL
jgi:hypothetical protein